MFARIEEDTIIEILKPLSGKKLSECFHPDILKNGEYVPDYLQVGDSKVDGEWPEATAEEPAEDPAEEPAEEPASEEPVAEEPAK